MRVCLGRGVDDLGIGSVLVLLGHAAEGVVGQSSEKHMPRLAPQTGAKLGHQGPLFHLPTKGVNFGSTSQQSGRVGPPYFL